VKVEEGLRGGGGPGGKGATLTLGGIRKGRGERLPAGGNKRK